MAAKKTDSKKRLEELIAEDAADAAKKKARDKEILEISSTEIIECLTNAVELSRSLSDVSPEAKKLLRQLNKSCGVSYTKTTRKSDKEKVELLDEFLEGRKEFTEKELKTYSKEKGFVFTSAPRQFYGKFLEDRAETFGKDGLTNKWRPKTSS
jgi:hypothetical protein